MSVRSLRPESAISGGPPETREAAAHLADALRETALDTEAALDALLPQPNGLHRRAQEAMRYAVFAGGKRLRPFLVLQCAGLFAAPRDRALRVAAAIEAMHTYSLVHDDLPAMDNDDLRRGKPTVHRQFDEATAILAGDGLLTVAFELLADSATHPSGEIRAELVASLARAAGSEGMIGGQMIDIEAPETDLNASQVIELQQKKTGALFEFSCVAGAILAGATPADRTALAAYARDLGLAFQICDDLIDVLGSSDLAGKQVGKDQTLGKATLVSLWGVDRARLEAERLAAQARETLSDYGAEADLLRTLPFYLLDRRN